MGMAFAFVLKVNLENADDVEKAETCTDEKERLD